MSHRKGSRKPPGHCCWAFNRRRSNQDLKGIRSEVALYCDGLGYCLAKAGKYAESVAQHRRAVELEPNHHVYLNDLGYSLLQAGRLDEAEEVLQRAVELAPSDYARAKENLDHLRKVRHGA